jgi:hypothetical protein
LPLIIRCHLLLLFTIALLFQLNAQEKQDDVVYLKNGTFLRGIIVGEITGNSLKIKLGSRDTLEVPMNDVKEIKKEPVPEPDGYEDGVKAWGYTNITELTFGSGYSEGVNRKVDPNQDQVSVQISTMNGFTLTQYIQLGIGVGLDFWKNRGFLPIYLDLRANLFKSVASPFLYINVGYAPGWMKNEPGMGLGGALAAIGAGAKFNIGGRLAMVCSIGYRFQQIRLWQFVNQVKSKATLDANFFTIRAGVLF